MTQPFCSIIIPAYNAEKTIDNCLESLSLRSSFANNLEIIVIDDGSVDKTAAIAQKVLDGIPNTRVISLPNGGVSSARNAGLERACGKYICFLDADDEIDRKALDLDLNLIKECNYDYLVADYLLIEKRGKKPKPVVCALPHGERLPAKNFQKDFFSAVFTYSGQGLTTVWGKLYKRSLIEQARLRFDERQKYGEDLIFAMQFAELAKSLYVSHNSFYRYYSSEMAPYRKRDYSYDLTKVHGFLLSLNDTYGAFAKDSTSYFAFEKRFFLDATNYLNNHFISEAQKKAFLKTPDLKSTIRYLKCNKSRLTHNDRMALFFLTPLCYRLALKWV